MGRVPIDRDYALLLGKAVYTFAYYEFNVIWVIERIRPGFLGKYSREAKMTSRAVFDELKKAANRPDIYEPRVSKTAMADLLAKFETLIALRNALIHGHPMTAADGSQVLGYQAPVNSAITDKVWTSDQIEDFLDQVDAAACTALAIDCRLR